MTQPRRIVTARYNTDIEFDISHIDMNKVKNWYVKWRELIIVFKDCTELIINESEDYNEYKCPESSKIMIYNNHNEIYETDSDYEN